VALPLVDQSAGLFTTLLVVDGRPVDLDRHVTRLAKSVAYCYGSDLPATLPARVQARASRLRGRHRLRITVVPDSAGIGEPSLDSVFLPKRPAAAWRLVPVVVRGGIGPHKYNDRRFLDAVEPAAGTWSAECDALLCDADGALLETGRGNLFVVTDDAVHTPALDGRLLPGVARQRVIEQLKGVGIDVAQHRLTLDDLAHATEVFVSNSVDGARPVSSVDGAGAWDPGPTTSWLGTRLPVRERPPRPVELDTGPPGGGVTLLLIDNYDSFVYNLDQYVRELGAHTEVVRNDAIRVEEIATAVEQGNLQGIIISPGPGTPAEAGASKAVVEHLGSSVPILGVCLGHQCIAEVYGARVVRADVVVHGKRSLVHHDGSGVFAGLDGPLLAARYHSLVVSEEPLPPELRATAHTASGVLMGIRHRALSIEGIQIHPESILTRQGHHILGNFLRTCSSPQVRGPHPLREGVRSHAG